MIWSLSHWPPLLSQDIYPLTHFRVGQSERLDQLYFFQFPPLCSESMPFSLHTCVVGSYSQNKKWYHSHTALFPGIRKSGHTVTSSAFFDTVKFQPKGSQEDIKRRAEEKKINLRYYPCGRVSFKDMNEISISGINVLVCFYYGICAIVCVCQDSLSGLRNTYCLPK